MADKKNANSLEQESERHFLDRTNVGGMIKEVLAKLVGNRPDDPVTFLADHFETLNDKMNRVVKAHQQICLAHYSRPAFEANILLAYEVLSQTKVNKHVRGLMGTVYTDILLMLCRDFPVTLRDNLLKKIQCREHEVVVYNVFRSGVLTCLIMQDYIKQSEALFKSLDLKGSGQSDHSLCQSIATQLSHAIQSTSIDPATCLEASQKLGPNSVYTALNKAWLDSGGKDTMSCEDFVILTTGAFLQKITPLR